MREDRTVPPIVINVRPAEGLPGWVAPLVGFVGVLIGLVGTNLLTQVRERRAFHRDKRLELYLDLQNEEYEVRRWASKVGHEPVEPEWLEINGRWSSLMLRLDLFASPDVRQTARSFYHESHGFLRVAAEATSRPTRQRPWGVAEEQVGRLRAEAQDALDTFSQLWDLMRRDLGVKGSSALTRSTHDG